MFLTLIRFCSGHVLIKIVEKLSEQHLCIGRGPGFTLRELCFNTVREHSLLMTRGGGGIDLDGRSKTNTPLKTSAGF